MDYRKIREALREQRFRMRMRVQDVSAEADVDRATLYRIENTKKYPDYRPELDTLSRLAVAMGTTLLALDGAPATAASEPSREQVEAREMAQMWLELPPDIRASERKSLEALVSYLRTAASPPGVIPARPATAQGAHRTAAPAKRRAR